MHHRSATPMLLLATGCKCGDATAVQGVSDTSPKGPLPTWVSGHMVLNLPPNTVLIGSAISAGLTAVTNRQNDAGAY